MKERYVLGFLFVRDLSCVLLIEKSHPAWQKGFLNGIGGKVKKNEKPLNAMIREFKEEASALVEDWKHFCSLETKEATIETFFSVDKKGLDVHPATDEQIYWSSSSPLPAHALSNLGWLIPMAILFSKKDIHWKDRVNFYKVNEIY